MADEPGYHGGVPMLPPAKAREVADKLRIQIIGLRAGWSAWAAGETDIAAEAGPVGAAGERWRKLMLVDGMLRAAESQLEMAIERIAKEDADV